MCGLAGILRLHNAENSSLRHRVGTMIRTLRHRGPDSCGFYTDDEVGLAHARLSIIDLLGGNQPMSNEDESLWVSFNGEIYNYVELREELFARGHWFRTNADTEVILHAYEEWGEEAFLRFNGQWAFALWDRRRHELLLCRDRVGVRPLFVTSRGSEILFASEVKALFADTTVPRRLDPHGLAQVFTYWSTLAPTTMFEGISELLPGSYRIYNREGLRKEVRYWSPPFSPVRTNTTCTMHEAEEELKRLLTDAVRLRMTRADVSVGSYLSGGIDSSLVASLAREHVPGLFSTFSVRFADSEFDESPYQQMMVESLGSAHHDVLVTRDDIARVFPDVVYWCEQPVLRTAPAPMFILSRLAQERGFKTVLTGEGADEFLGGYDIYREAKIRSFWARQPASLVRPRLFDRVYPYLARSPQQARAMALEYWRVGLESAGQPGFSHERRWTTTRSLQRFFSRDLQNALADDPPPVETRVLPAGFREWDELAQAQLLEIETFFSGYLLSSQGDRMLMAHGVEGRFPFLDAGVMEFCCSLPSLCTLPGLNEKAVLKRIARERIPEQIWKRPKQPYRAPDAVCFFSPAARERTADILSDRAVRHAGVFDPAIVARLVHKLGEMVRRDGEHATPGNADNMAFTGILSTHILYKRFLGGAPIPADSGPTPWETRVDVQAGTADSQKGAQ